jgi:hypothetical protein
VSPDGSGPTDRARIRFADTVLFELRDKGGGASIKQRSLPATRILNRAWHRRLPLVLAVEPRVGGAALLANGELLLTALPGDGEAAPIVLARRWAAEIAHVFAAGGRPVRVVEAPS